VPAVRKALLFSILVVTFGCKKASTPEPLEDAAPAAATSVSADADNAEVEELGGDQAGGGGKKGGGAAGGDGGSAGGESADGGGGGAAANEGGDGGAAGSAGGAGGDGGNAAGGGTTAGGGGGAEPGKTADPNPTQPGAPYGNVEFVVTSAAGGTSTDVLKAALEKNKQRFRGCYGKEPGNSGTLKMRVTIASDGVIEKPEVMGGNLAPGSLLQCTVATVKSTKVAGATAPATKATFDVKYFK